jgi:leucyl-tRNA synthetase
MKKYSPKEIEPKWQKFWQETGTYTADLKSKKPKYIAMSMFNYPSGVLHVGHAMNFTISDVKARFKRQQGFESYHPVGWDSFGLPAENRAVKAGVSPQESMAEIIPRYRELYKRMGWSNDWEKEIATHLPEYYKWTQWVFSQMYKNGLTYQDSRMQWWCEQCQTVLANEQVDSHGKCWRHDGSDDPMIGKREVKQWFFKITDYADELLEATDSLDWTESVKIAQRNWIGKSSGAEIKFKVEDSDDEIEVFTTRPDTLFGATFLVLAPEHELAAKITTTDCHTEVDDYIKKSLRKSEIERQADKEKSGVFTGSYAINPINDEKIPIWIADYVLGGYGTGAIMCVPAHDERDNEFAVKYGLPIVDVIAPNFGTVLPDTTDVTGPVVIGYDPRIKQFMSLINRRNNTRWFASGGLNEGESYEDAALRELQEEAGFAKVEKLIKLGGPNYSYYYNVNKDSNRRSFSHMFLAIINKDDAGKQNLESHEDYQVVWSDLDSIRKDMIDQAIDGDRDHWIDGLDRAGEAVKRYAKNQGYIHVLNGEGTLFNSGEYDGIQTSEAREKIVAKLAKNGIAKEKINYKMRDWSATRQRYWGAPTPIIHCQKCGPVLVPDGDLPVILPELEDFKPSGDGRSALARATDWLKVDCPECGAEAERETDTLDTYICSSWYMYRYFDPHNQEKIFDSEIAKKWEPIDFYNGGDHAVAHLLYARFVARFFNKIGLIDNPEPFKQMLFNGKVRASDGTEFSKRKGNGVDPVGVIDSGYGADALRLYHMFAAPLELNARWDPQGVPGMYRFLNRIWNLVQEYDETSAIEVSEAKKNEVLFSTNKMAKKATKDIEESHYNTAIAAIMECSNELYKLKTADFGKSEVWQEALETLVSCVAPFAPHIAEELWQDLGHSSTIHKDTWPTWDEKYLTSDTVKIAVQINGKLKSEIEIASDAEKDSVLESAKADAKVATAIDGKEIKKEIYVPGRIVNLVV